MIMHIVNLPRLFFLSLLTGALCGFSACGDPAPRALKAAEAAAKEREAIMAFVQLRPETYTEDSLGIWVHVVQEGDSVHPSLSSTITVAYRTESLSGLVIDTASVAAPLRIRLARLIPGWQHSLPRIGQGGSLRMVVPSSLAYGDRSIHPELGGHTPLFFEVSLLQVDPLLP